MPYTMHAIQTNQTRSHQRVLRRFTDALPLIEGQIHELIATNLRRFIETNGTCKGKSTLLSPLIHLLEKLIIA